MVRYERQRPGELIHLDTKKLGRIKGIGHRISGRRSGAINRHHGTDWEALHVPSMMPRAWPIPSCLPTRKKTAPLLSSAARSTWFARHGVAVERIMTDNGSAYRSNDFRHRLTQLGIKHIRTRPYTPRTNGKAERFIQTSLREWACARAYQSSAERGQAMNTWMQRV